MTYKYLASPYTHPDQAVMHARYELAESCLAWMLDLRMWAYSPIVHCHALGRKQFLPPNHEFWRDYDRAMILGSNGVLVLTIDGWDKSKGVAEEIRFADENHIMVRRITIVGRQFTIDNFAA